MRKRHKYSAKKQVTEDGRFDSKKELRVWGDLKVRQMAGEISELSRDRKLCTFDLHGVNGDVVCRYIADYVFLEDGRSVAADAKGMKTPIYRLKRKLFLAEHGSVWIHREY